MKRTYKKFGTFFPLVISLLVYSVYAGIELCVLRPKGLRWRPYMTTGTLVIITIGFVFFFVLLGYKLIKGIRDRRKPLKILCQLVLIGFITFCISSCGVNGFSLAYTHEKVVKTDETWYVSCLNDWNPSYYRYYEYDSWFTMGEEKND